MKRKAFVWIFAAYCVLVAGLLFIRERYAVADAYWTQIAGNVNVVPLRTVALYFRLLTGNYTAQLRCHALVNLLGNVALFIPFGYCLPWLRQNFRPFWKCMLKGGTVITCVELIQLFLLVGRCDVDDLLLNLLGIALGYAAYSMSGRKNSS